MLANLSLRIKLYLLSGTGVIALLIAVLVGTFGISSGVEGVKAIGRQRLPSVLVLQNIREAQVALKSSTYEVPLWESDTEAQDQFSSIANDKKKLWEQADASIKSFDGLPKSDEEQKLWRDFLEQWQRWRVADQNMVRLILQLSQNRDAAKQAQLFQTYYTLGGQQRPFYVSAEKLLGDVLALNTKIVEQETVAAESATGVAWKAMVAVGVTTIILMLTLGYFIAASILRQMGGEPAAAVQIIRRIAEGDLTQRIEVSVGDEDSVLASMSYMQQRLHELIAQVRASAEELFSSSTALASDVGHVLENGSKETAAAQRTASEVENIAQQVSHVGGSAEAALNLSEQAGAHAKSGQIVIRDAASEMGRIAEAVGSSAELIEKLGEYSSQISSIVSVISGIAEQTNLLALNAAIEAARAGDQGRGFAVVADEVRSLSQRTAQSTGQITSMISTIQNGVNEAIVSMRDAAVCVDRGVKMVNEATATMEDIHRGAESANSAVNEITYALRESTESLHQIAASMESIVVMVERSGQSVTKISKSADGIEKMAQTLSLSVNTFTI
jgi:methyl-accepting chemotaxis protein